MKKVQPIRNLKDIDHMRKTLFLMHPKYAMMFSLGINTGLRISDIVGSKSKDKDGNVVIHDGLRVRDVLGKTHVTIKEQKTGKTKRFLLNKNMQKEINKYVKDNDLHEGDFLVQSRKGENKSITRIQAYRVLNQAAETCGLSEIGTHTMRKTFGYHYYKRTHDVAMLMDIFNHSAPSITLRYIGINDDMKDESLKYFYL